MIKILLFKGHIIGIYITTFGWLLTKYFLYLHFIVILSWLLNNNKCLISQIEYYFFKETFMGKGKKYFVPKKQRYLLYLNFLLGIIFNYFI